MRSGNSPRKDNIIIKIQKNSKVALILKSELATGKKNGVVNEYVRNVKANGKKTIDSYESKRNPRS